MILQSPTVGPIVGHASDRECRIFLRGDRELASTGIRRCFGVVRWRPQGGAWSVPLFNKLSVNFDMTGVFVLGGLVGDTHYEYQAGWFFAESELDRIGAVATDQIVWPPDSECAVFKTASVDPAAARSYIVGSCRYLLRVFDQDIFDDRGDKLFRSVLDQIGDGQAVDALVMIGDQIYADDLGAVSPDTHLDEFLKRYRVAFTQQYLARLMATTRTYMILDDHEIEDNWPAKASSRDRVTTYPRALHAYQVYQCSHSPVLDATDDGRLDGTPDHFWYTFRDGCAQWFVMDARTERNLAATPQRMIGEPQMTALLAWLSDASGLVKFVVSSVPVFPDLVSDAADKWDAFPEQRARILDHIRVSGVRNVVFVSGDVHCSFVSGLTSSIDPGFSIYSIVSSSFFWPYTHGEQHDFVFGQPLAGAGSYESTRLVDIIPTDNFARVTISPTQLDVYFFSRKGEHLSTVNLPFLT